MAQPLQSINLVAPAFKGINTEDSPLAQDTAFAEVADNAIIDRSGRLASRKGNTVSTTNKTVLGTDYLHNIHEFYDSPQTHPCLLYTSPSPRDRTRSRMPSSA